MANTHRKIATAGRTAGAGRTMARGTTDWNRISKTLRQNEKSLAFCVLDDNDMVELKIPVSANQLTNLHIAGFKLGGIVKHVKANYQVEGKTTAAA